MAKFRPDRIENMMREYSKFGLDESQLKQLKSILQSGRVSVEQTNTLITDAASNELQMGRSYVGKGSSEGILQSRNNLLKLIGENSQSTPKVTPNSASPSPSPSNRSSALARANSRIDLVRQNAPTSTPPSSGGGLAKNPGYQGGSGARPGGARVNIEGGGIPTPGNPGGYGNPKATPKPNNVSVNVSTPKPQAKPPSAKGLGKGLLGNAIKALNVWDVVRPGAHPGARLEAAAYMAAPLYTTLAMTVTGSEDRTTKWKRLGYKSPEAYEKAMQDYETRTGKSAETGKPLSQSPASQPPRETPNAPFTEPSIEFPQAPTKKRPKASGTVITIDEKRYDTGYHAEEIAALRDKNPGGGNAGQSQSINPNNSSYIPPTRNTEAPVKNPYNIPQSGTQMTIGDFESNIGVKVTNRTSDDYKVNPISRMEELSLDSNLDSLEALRQSEARRGIVNQGNDRGMRMRFLNTDNGLERITDEGYKVLMNQKAGSALDDNFLEQYKYNPAGNKDVQKWMGKTKAEINAAYDAMSPEEKKAQGMNMHKAFMVDQDNPASKAKGKATAWQATANSPSEDIQPIKINDSGKVSQQSVYQGFKKRGLSDSDARIGAAIMMGESGGNPTIDTVQSGLDPDKSNEFSVGIMQINTKAHMDKLTKRGLSVDDLRNPEINLDLAVDVFKEAGGSWSPWGAYTNKSYEQFLS